MANSSKKLVSAGTAQVRIEVGAVLYCVRQAPQD